MPPLNIVTSWGRVAAAKSPLVEAAGSQPARGRQEKAAPLSPAPWPAATFAQLRKVLHWLETSLPTATSRLSWWRSQGSHVGED